MQLASIITSASLQILGNVKLFLIIYIYIYFGVRSIYMCIWNKYGMPFKCFDPRIPCHSFADYGCMLDILNLELLPDGRSYVETVGGNRFRVLRRGQRDGYQTADIEYLEDHKVRGYRLH